MLIADLASVPISNFQVSEIFLPSEFISTSTKTFVITDWSRDLIIRERIMDFPLNAVAYVIESSESISKLKPPLLLFSSVVNQPSNASDLEV